MQDQYSFLWKWGGGGGRVWWFGLYPLVLSCADLHSTATAVKHSLGKTQDSRVFLVVWQSG